MKSRCENPNHSRYKDWGGKGVTICERWKKFANFLADMGEVPSSLHTLDRIDPNGNYEPSNCRWATGKQQQRNRRDSRKLTFKDRTQSIWDWADETKLPYYVIINRMKWGWDAERILTTPVNANFSQKQGKLITHQGRTQNVSQWARELGIKFVTLWWRLNQGWPTEKAFAVKEQDTDAN